MDELSTEYFSTNNNLFKAFLGDIAMVKSSHGESWNELSHKQQAKLIDKFYKISNDDNSVNDEASDGGGYDSDDYFNILKINSGEKVVVDFDNDANGWTWVDEHSAPFSWKSKSQQDLRLKDLFDESYTETLNNTKNNSNNSSYSTRNKIEPKKDALNESANEIEMMFKKFGLNASIQNQSELTRSINQELISEPLANQEEVLKSPSNKNEENLTCLVQDLKRQAIDECVEDNSNSNIASESNSINVNKLHHSHCNGDQKNTTSSVRGLKSGNHTIELNHDTGESSTDHIDTNDAISNIDTISVISTKDKITSPSNIDNKLHKKEYGDDNDKDVVISSQPKSEIHSLKKTGFDFLDNW